MPQLSAPDGPVSVDRDQWGIADITAGSARDAFWGLGFAAATDRLWQLEYDRRRALGRWSEVVGPDGVPGDTLGRDLDLVKSAQADLDVMDAATLDTFTAYAEGVNAAAVAGPLPPEFGATSTSFEPWLPVHSVAAFKIRHVLMGSWLTKISRLMILAGAGATAFAATDQPARAGMRLTTPAGARMSADEPAISIDPDRLAALAQTLAFLVPQGLGPDRPDLDGGSNVWAVSGSRTASGKPMLVNDSHRLVDVPNAYWQVRLSCPEFTVAGATFPGLPGFPHFGHNGSVGWAITHGAADTQDLAVEEFRGTLDDLECRTADGWAKVDVRTETIEVAGADPVTIRCLRTPSGPVLHQGRTDTGGFGLSLRWTATYQPCRQFAALVPMLTAASVTDLIGTQDVWVDPVNNLVCADTGGDIGYLLRGALPVRDDKAAMRIALPAWESGWRGLTRDRMPVEINPPGGVIANANNQTTDPSAGPQVAHGYCATYRAERLWELLGAAENLDLDDMQRFQADVVSVAARAWSEQLHRRGPYGSGHCEQARLLLAGWDGDLAAVGPAPLLYACFKRSLAWTLLAQVVPDELMANLGALPAIDSLMRDWLGRMVWRSPDRTSAADTLDDDTMRAGLSDAWAAAVDLAGPDPSAWSWAGVHQLMPAHLLAPTLPSPDSRPVRGDGETVAAAGYLFSTRRGAFPATLTSVYRQLLDFDDLSRSRWIIPGGSQADPSSPHYQDQLGLWAAGELIWMHPDLGPS